MRRITEKLKALNRAIKSAEGRRAEEKQWVEKQRKKEEKADRRFWQEESRKLDKKLGLAEDIFRWCRKFSRTKEYRKMLALGFDCGQDIKKSLKLYYGRWGHERGRGMDDSCLSQLCLRKDGTLHYIAGYKWMWPLHERTFKTARELAKGLTKDYLKELHHFITTGRVYEKLQKEVKESLKRGRQT